MLHRISLSLSLSVNVTQNLSLSLSLPYLILRYCRVCVWIWGWLSLTFNLILKSFQHQLCPMLLMGKFNFRIFINRNTAYNCFLCVIESFSVQKFILEYDFIAYFLYVHPYYWKRLKAYIAPKIKLVRTIATSIYTITSLPVTVIGYYLGINSSFIWYYWSWSQACASVSIVTFSLLLVVFLDGLK